MSGAGRGGRSEAGREAARSEAGNGKSGRGGSAAARRAWFGRVEIPAADPRAAAAFYLRVFGWAGDEAAAGPDSGQPYVTLRTAAGRAGAGVAAPAVLGAAQPLAVVHVEGEELAAVLARVTAAGGAVDLTPTAVGGHGTFARFRDPDGNLLGLWSSVRGGSGND